MTPSPLTFVPTQSGHELRRDDELLARVARQRDGDAARAEIGGASYELTIEGDREALAATWQLVARDEAGEEAATYYHGSMRGGRVKFDGRVASLRRELGLAMEWKLRVKPDAALTLRPVPRPEGVQIDLVFVPGSAEVPQLLLALVCWCVVIEEASGPVRRSG